MRSEKDYRYNHSPKGRARALRYSRSAKGHATDLRYRYSAERRITTRRYRSKPGTKEHSTCYKRSYRVRLALAEAAGLW